MTNGSGSKLLLQRTRTALDFVATIALLFAAVLVVWKNWPRGPSVMPIPTEPIAIGSAHTLGSRTAEIVMFQFSDFQCPFCGQFARETEPAFRSKYVDSGRILYVFKHLPIEARHPAAFQAAEVTECAAEQGLFWPVHDEIFMDQSALDLPSVFKRIMKTGIDTSRLAACLGPAASASVRDDMAMARSLSIRSTPTFLVGTLADGRATIKGRLSGNLDMAALDRLISEAEQLRETWFGTWLTTGFVTSVGLMLPGNASHPKASHEARWLSIAP